MKNPVVDFTKFDHKIIESYKDMMEGLAEYLGPNYELVLHSMESLEHSVIKIVNGFHSGRKVGSPITDFGLSMLSEIQKNPEKKAFCYFNRNKQGEPLKSCTLTIHGEHGKLIGMVCINFYLNASFESVIQSFMPTNFIPQESNISETFSDSIEDLIQNSIEEVKKNIYSNHSISISNKNKEIIAELYRRGIFNLKDSVVKIADKLGISKNTVYMHIRNIK
ncbi:MAG: PAS domain-containing protein [Clostridiales bacterium]|nr:PAS domain-containing protein [Clostridiales bacterium]